MAKKTEVKSKDTSKNWFVRHKVWTAIIVLFIIGIASSASSKPQTNNNSTSSTKNAASNGKTYRFNDRADKQKGDVEVAVGEPATVDGVKMTVISANRSASLSEFEKAPDGKQYIVAAVQLENTSDKTKPFNPYDFKIQTAGGQVLDPTFSLSGDLKSGDLVAGGKTSGNIVLEVPIESSPQYLIWKPSAFNAERAIVQIP